jgi:hypothetical protein
MTHLALSINPHTRLVIDPGCGFDGIVKLVEAAPRGEPKPRKPTLASVAKQANKAAIPVARYEVKPDGTVVVVTGEPESIDANPWDEVLIDAADKKRPS